MSRDSFLDTNIIINYVKYQKDKSNEIISKCYSYIINKQGRFLVCYAVIRELSNIVTKLSIIHKEVLKKIDNESYSLSNSGNLSKRDVPFAEKLYWVHKEVNKNKLKEIFASERDIFEIEIDKFLKNKADTKVVPIEQIKVELVNLLREFIENYADCQILASALQYQQGKEEFIFVTADKHFDQNTYYYLKEEPKLSQMRLPELKNLLFEK